MSLLREGAYYNFSLICDSAAVREAAGAQTGTGGASAACALIYKGRIANNEKENKYSENM
jgi:hypothetical protein